jgi:putative peptide zinc metalloprotease protein
MYTRDTIVSVQPFTRQVEGEDVIIGRVETGVFLAIPSEAVELLDELAQGKTIGEVSDLFLQKYGETPDLDDFLQELETKGIVKPAVQGDNGNGATAPVSAQMPRVRYHFSNFPHRLAQLLFSSPVLVGLFALIVLACAAAIRDPSLAPGPRDLYFPDRRALTWTILMVAVYATIFVHELGHLIAARALGINSRIGISHRLWYLVVETDLTGLWSVPKRQRYLPMLAGVLIDAVSGSLLLLLLFAHKQQWLALADFAVRLVRAMMFTYVMRILWQFFFFVRTDFYFVIASLLNCRNLLKDTEGFLRNQLARIVSFVRPVDQSAIPDAERRVIRVYSVLWLGGRILAFSVLFAVTLPVGVLYIRNLSSTFRNGYSASPSDFVDAVALAAYFFIPLTLGLTLWLGGLMRHRRA